MTEDYKNNEGPGDLPHVPPFSNEDTPSTSGVGAFGGTQETFGGSSDNTIPDQSGVQGTVPFTNRDEESNR